MSKPKTKPLTPIQIHAMNVLREKGPLLGAGVGEAVWPDRHFKSRQGAGFAGGCLMGKLDKLGLVFTKYHERADSKGRIWPAGWALTTKGEVALAEAATPLVNSKHEAAMKLSDEERWVEAAELEREAADLCPHSEPSRSVLHRSAGNLAMLADLPEVALAMARGGLRGDPPNAIKSELEALEKAAWKLRAKKKREAERSATQLVSRNRECT